MSQSILFPQIPTEEEFEAYCAGPFKTMLTLLSLNMSSKSLKMKQAAARALGFSAYESLVSHWSRQRRIQKGIAFESCPVQEDRFTLKAKNILFVYDPSKSRFIGLSLRPGEEGRFLSQNTLDNCEDVASVRLPKGSTLLANQSCKSFHESVDESMNESTVRGTLFYSVVIDDMVETGNIHIMRTGEGIIIDVYHPHDEDDVFSTCGLMFSDRQYAEDSEEEVDLVSNEPVYGGDFGVYYSWMKTGIDYDGRNRLLHINPNEEMDISSLMFKTPKEAKDAIYSGQWAITEEEMEEIGGVLVKNIEKIVPSPF